MSLLPHILGSIHIIDIRFKEDETYERIVWCCTVGGVCKRMDYDIKKLTNKVAVVTVNGNGVVSKPSYSNIIAKIAADPENFIQSENNGEVSFTRRNRLDEFLQELTLANIYPIRIGCAETPDAAAKAAFGMLHWRMLVRIDLVSSSVAQAVAHRLMPILLGLFLMLLSINAAISGDIQLHRQQLLTQSQTLQQHNTKIYSASAERQRIIQNFAQRMPTDYAILCDYIGSCVPDQIILTELNIEPLTKRFEQNKPLTRALRSAVIRGTSPSTAAISTFTEALSTIQEIRSVKLISIEKIRNTEMQFLIEIEL